MFRVTAGIRLRARSPFGAPSRHSPGCYPWLSFGLRFLRQRAERTVRPPAASSSQPGRNAGRAGSEAARAQSAKPRAGTPLAPSNGTPPVDAPDERAFAYVAVAALLSSRQYKGDQEQLIQNSFFVNVAAIGYIRRKSLGG